MDASRRSQVLKTGMVGSASVLDHFFAGVPKGFRSLCLGRVDESPTRSANAPNGVRHCKQISPTLHHARVPS